jgi:hypothetical protein
MDRSKPGLGSSSLVLDNSKIWKKLWATKVPGKMKITLWRFAQDCLPCGHQLQKRHVPVSTSCIYCHQHETVEHALLFCPFAKEVWQDVKSDHMIHLHRMGFTSPRVWTLDFMDRCSQIEATILMVTFCHIWHARNKYREGEGILNPFSIAAKIKAYIELIIKHLYKPSPANRREPSTSSPKWVLPPVGTVMVNVDAALFASTRQMGASIMIRDHIGAFLAACGERIDEVITLELAEALAVRRAVSFCLEEGYSRVIVGSDCLAVVQ